MVEKKGKIKIEIKADNAQDIGMNCSTKAGSCVELDKVTDEATARPLSDSSDLKGAQTFTLTFVNFVDIFHLIISPNHARSIRSRRC